MKQYKITLSRNQLRVIMVALEDYFRTRMGQFFDFSSDVARNGYEYCKDNPENDRLFDDYIRRRNESEEMFRRAYDVATPDIMKRGKTPDMETAIDIWHVIRHQRYLEVPEPKDHYTVDAYKPFPVTNEPLITIERIESDE